MRCERLEGMKLGWFVGDFTPAAVATSAAEVAIKKYAAGASEARHYHRVATEVTAVLSGEVLMNGARFVAGDIVVIEPLESTDFRAVLDTVTVVVKIPSVPNDKYLCEDSSA